MNLRELVREGEEILNKAGVPEARHDARALFLDTFHISAQEYILYAENTPEQAFPTLGEGLAMPLGYYRDRIKMRAARIPLQQILGETSFMGLDFKVNEFTLSPRQDTEVLVEEVLRDEEDLRRSGTSLNRTANETGNEKAADAVRAGNADSAGSAVSAASTDSAAGRTGRKLLDLCTGTGCIGISLGLLGGFDDVTLTDLSKEALEVARFNAEKLSKEKADLEDTAGMERTAGRAEDPGISAAAAPGICKFSLYQGDLFDALPAGSRFDVIVSNPPYIADAVIETLEPEVKTYEPRMALSGGADGLDIYRRLIARAPEYAPVLYLEIGYDQAEAVTALMEQAGYKNIAVIKDYGGNDRVVKGNIR